VIAPPRIKTPSPAALIVSIDTEEEGLWGGIYRRQNNTVENTRGIERFQSFCDRHGVKPTYLADTPVVEDERSSRLLKEIQDSGRSEVGAHLHPWCAPPHEEEISSANSFLCNLPENLQREKLRRLTEAIEERLGRRPTSFRAGRYGLDAVGARILQELGYVVDSSVIPFCDYSSEGGPCYTEAPYTPYYVDGALVRPAESGELLEVPVSVGFNRINFRRATRWRDLASRSPLKSLHAVGLLDRMGILQRIKFSPEQSDAARMKRLAAVYAAKTAPCLVMLFHSSSLVPGYSPYVPDARSLERFYRNLEETFRYCLDHLGMVSHTLTEFAWAFSSRTVAMRAESGLFAPPLAP
jgi:hypothetical protein